MAELHFTYPGETSADPVVDLIDLLNRADIQAGLDRFDRALDYHVSLSGPNVEWLRITRGVTAHGIGIEVLGRTEYTPSTDPEATDSNASNNIVQFYACSYELAKMEDPVFVDSLQLQPAQHVEEIESENNVTPYILILETDETRVLVNFENNRSYCNGWPIHDFEEVRTVEQRLAAEERDRKRQEIVRAETRTLERTASRLGTTAFESIGQILAERRAMNFDQPDFFALCSKLEEREVLADAMQSRSDGLYDLLYKVQDIAAKCPEQLDEPRTIINPVKAMAVARMVASRYNQLVADPDMDYKRRREIMQHIENMTNLIINKYDADPLV